MKKLLRANGRCKAAKKEFTRVPAGSYKFIFLRKTNAVPPKAFNCCHCHLDGNCLKSAVIYQAIVATEDNRPDETYVSLTENSFKTRYSNHKSSFRDPNKRLSTELSKHIWPLKDAKIGFSLTWKILKQAAPLIPLQIAVIYACGKNISSSAEPIWRAWTSETNL